MTQHGSRLPAFDYRSSFIGPQIQSHAGNINSAPKRQSLTSLSLRNVIVSLITSPFRESSNCSDINTTNQQAWEWFRNINFQFISSPHLYTTTQHRYSSYSSYLQNFKHLRSLLIPTALLWSRCERSERRIYQTVLHSSDLAMHFIPGVLDIVSYFQTSPDLHELTL